MANENSREDLVRFLDDIGSNGLMNPQTASARKASVNTLLGILPNDEAQDVTKLDMDSVTQRFMNLKGGKFKQESVRVYKSRVEGAIRDFINYKKDPLSFKPKLVSRGTRTNDKKPKMMEEQPSHGVLATATSVMSVTQTEGIVFPIPIRPNVIVKIAGIPSDMTQSEAKKICNVLMALGATNELF
jgi:site-specific recombinase XerC